MKKINLRLKLKDYKDSYYYMNLKELVKLITKN